MKCSKSTKNVSKMKLITRNLSKSKKVTVLDKGEEKEAWTLALSFEELTQSFNVLTEKLFPKLVKPSLTASQIEDVLFDIRFEFQHILYHIKDPKYYREDVENYWKTI